MKLQRRGSKGWMLKQLKRGGKEESKSTPPSKGHSKELKKAMKRPRLS
jgi:hypothetical protein